MVKATFDRTFETPNEYIYTFKLLCRKKYSDDNPISMLYLHQPIFQSPRLLLTIWFKPITYTFKHYVKKRKHAIPTYHYFMTIGKYVNVQLVDVLLVEPLSPNEAIEIAKKYESTIKEVISK
jgi:hypothetical protein